MGNPEQENNADATSQPSGSESVDFEKRFKDTQGAFTKSQQEVKALKAKMEVLEKLTTPKVELDEATRTELEDLKFSDPDKWRNKMNQLEIEAQTKHKETLTEAERLVNQQTELESRTQLLSDFQKSHPNLQLTDDVIKYDVPPRITNKLESGEITFEQYLSDVASYLGSPKVIGDGNQTLRQPNLNKSGGDHNPSDNSIKKDIVKDYADIVF